MWIGLEVGQYGIPALLWLAWNHTATSFWWLPYRYVIVAERHGFVATECIFWTQNITKMRLRPRLHPGPLLQHSPRSLNWFRGFRRRRGVGMGGGEKTEKGREKNRSIPVLTFPHFEPCTWNYVSCSSIQCVIWITMKFLPLTVD